MACAWPAARQSAGRPGSVRGELAPLTSYSRGTVANVETGRQHVPRDFWDRCDAALQTGGALARGYDEVEAAARRGSNRRKH